jgi:MerR family mercuric resistance operon transcriptional regulator
MEGLTTGQLAKKAEVNIETIRYYERKGLIPKPHRRDSGYRQYPEEMITRILFIKHAKTLGFSLKEIKELLSLKHDPKTPCSEVRNRAQSKIEDIDGKIRTLQKMKKALSKLTKSCTGSGPAKECPILETLKNKKEGGE